MVDRVRVERIKKEIERTEELINECKSKLIEYKLSEDAALRRGDQGDYLEWRKFYDNTDRKYRWYISLLKDLKKELSAYTDIGHIVEETAREYVGSGANAELHSHSGCDIVAGIMLPGDTSFKPFGNILTLSYSIHRDKSPVITLGRTVPKGYTRGWRTIAGSMIFAVFDTRVLNEIPDALAKASAQRTNSESYISPPDKERVLPDMLPPFTVVCTFLNEYSIYHLRGAKLVIYGVEINDEGQTHSVDDMMTENVINFTARDIRLLQPVEMEHKKPGSISQGGRRSTQW
mgnify:CR=1 FL=1